MLSPVLIWLIFGITGISCADKCSWTNCPKWPKIEGGINVHIIPHTHDDLGWIKTVDEYYTGSKSKLVPVGVQYIFNTVIDELQKSPDRRFSYAETGFLTRWLEDHDSKQIDTLKRLVSTGQFEFIGGGWVQPDEAASHYVELIDQYTLGLRKLNETFGECGRPKVAWQIDPFGHSREHANLVALIGYEALFFSRIHYLDQDVRIRDKNLEFIWNASDDLKTNILTGIFYLWGYGPPPGFCYDALCNDEPIIDNIALEGYNIDERVDQFLKYVKEKASHQKHNNVMILMGGDFTFSNANMWYTNLDKLIRAANSKSKETKITLTYSTPTCYVQALNAAGPSLSQKSDDFFPYASSNHSYWTGYFTSKPALKGLIRKSSSILQLVRQLNSFATSKNGEDLRGVEVLERAVGLSMHHDAVTGTSKENVTRDYERRLLRGINVGEEILNKAVQKLAKKGKNSTELPRQTLCNLLNESVCEASRQKKFTVTVFNGNAHEMNSIARIPYYGSSCIVKSADNEEVVHQIGKTFFPQTHKNISGIAPNELTFSVRVPALGFKTYFVNEEAVSHIEGLKSTVSSTKRRIRKKKATTKTISNSIIRLSFNEDGYLAQMKDLKTGTVHELSQEFFYYEGMSDLNHTTQATGAYIFRPIENESKRFESKIQLEIIELHRRAFHDDSWGVEEPLDEPGEDGRGLVVRGKHWLLLGTPDEILQLQRTAAYELFYEPTITFATYESIDVYNKNFVGEFSGITKALPPEINLLTLKRLSPDSILLRLEHIFQNGENPNLSTPIKLDIENLFTRFEIISMEELNLAGNVQSGIIRNWPNSWNSSKRRVKNLPREGISVELKPMEIKTWRLSVIEKMP
uniref:alpha-mannosidase n=1 Tax=Acrobeloides nanus TaxID=290746 RepID=A0A914C8W2_9BILA